ncbi:MAG: tetratricopeptide repeat protein [Desulfocapsaceae bacterium]|jgi:tetratricopeptide (TPR) repeat protein|nr:tetratricopeptide repeat protein [Desulfocapsaceae bacterium]
MSTPIQDISSIAPAGQTGEGTEDSRSQAQKDYDEGRGYVQKGENALAAASLHNALRGFEQEDNKEGIANASNQLGHLCLQREEFEKALTSYRRAWDICKELEDRISLQAISLQLVQVYRGLEEYRKSLDLCLDLLDDYQANNDPRGTTTVLEMMAEVYLASGDQEKAADTYNTMASIHANFNHRKIAESYRQKAAELGKQGA